MPGPQTRQDHNRKAASLGIPTKLNPVDYIILIAPNGDKYKVTVDNTGTLQTTLLP
jgi:hypothetical protein